MRLFGSVKLIGLLFNLHNHKYTRFNTKMPYCSTGAVHHSGVGNEKELVALLNATSTLNINQHISGKSGSDALLWRHLGGTQQKADCDVVSGENTYDVSIKHHDSSGGTFDWINTSKLTEFNPEIAGVIKPRVAEYKEKYKECTEVTKEMRSEMEEVFNSAFEHITSDQLKELFGSLYTKYPDYVLINDRAKERLVMYHKTDNFKEFVGYGDWEYYLKKSRAKTSRMVCRRKDGVEVNTNLRIRLVLNNGVNALVGLSEKNKCSIPCLKIQQDRVNSLLDGLTDPIIDKVEQKVEPRSSSPEAELLLDLMGR